MPSVLKRKNIAMGGPLLVSSLHTPLGRRYSMPVPFQVTFDCADVDAQANFWAAALGYQLQPPRRGIPVGKPGPATRD